MESHSWQEWEKRLAEVTAAFEAEIAAAADERAVEAIRQRYLGRKGGVLAGMLRMVGELPAAERPRAGQLANAARDAIEARLSERSALLAAAALERRLAEEKVDVSLPGWPIPAGHRHPISIVKAEIEDFFVSLGYDVVSGPETEYDYFNFEALNIPKEHPARDMHDSFYLGDTTLLRTHTSPMQIRYMRAHAPEVPLRVVVPGRTYRRDDDATHSPMFHQVEGLVVGEGVTMGDLKGTLLALARAIFGEATAIRMRPSYFPFTEPSAEVDVTCTVCGGSGCRTCKGTGWLEVLGSGMVHPQVLRNGGYDPERVSGFAFGLGIERMAMLKYGIEDLRHFYANDWRFLAQF